MTVHCAFSTRVETTVALELAASWKPLQKSNGRATVMMSMRMVMTWSGIQPHGMLHVACCSKLAERRSGHILEWPCAEQPRALLRRACPVRLQRAVL